MNNSNINPEIWPPRADPASLKIDPASLQRVLDFIAAEVQRGTVPGALFAATRHGQMFIEQAWGTYTSSDGPGHLLEPSVRFMFYSFSKMISASLVAMAHQDGLLDYDAPVCALISEFAAGGKENVTLRHLLTHSAGIPNAPALPVYPQESWAKAVEAVCAYPLEWEPGSRTLYHATSGLLIAAEIVRRIHGGRTWEEIARQHLFTPLGMGQTTFDTPPAGVPLSLTPIPESFPCPYDVTHYGFIGHPAGGAIGSLTDMLKLLNLHLQGGFWLGRPLLEPAEVTEMQRLQYQVEIEQAIRFGKTPAHEYWGLGWLLRGQTNEGWFGFGNVASPRAFGHAGINTVIGIADPARCLALAFVTTGFPPSDEETIRLRNTVTNLVMEATIP